MGAAKPGPDQWQQVAHLHSCRFWRLYIRELPTSSDISLGLVQQHSPSRTPQRYQAQKSSAKSSTASSENALKPSDASMAQVRTPIQAATTPGTDGTRHSSTNARLNHHPVQHHHLRPESPIAVADFLRFVLCYRTHHLRFGFADLLSYV